MQYFIDAQWKKMRKINHLTKLNREKKGETCLNENNKEIW